VKISDFLPKLSGEDPDFSPEGVEFELGGVSDRCLVADVETLTE